MAHRHDVVPRTECGDTVVEVEGRIFQAHAQQGDRLVARVVEFDKLGERPAKASVRNLSRVVHDLGHHEEGRLRQEADFPEFTFPLADERPGANPRVLGNRNRTAVRDCFGDG